MPEDRAFHPEVEDHDVRIQRGLEVIAIAEGFARSLHPGERALIGDRRATRWFGHGDGSAIGPAQAGGKRVGRVASHPADHVDAVQPGPSPALPKQLDRVRSGCAEGGFHRALLAQPAGEPPCVNAGDAGHPLLAEPGVEVTAASPVRDARAEGTDDHGRDLRAPRLVIIRVDPDIADVRLGENHPLAAVRRIGQDLLVPGHAGVKDHLKNRVGSGSAGDTGLDGSVFEDEGRAHIGVRM